MDWTNGRRAAALLGAALAAACGGDAEGGGGGGGGLDARPGYDGGTCFNLACQQTTCPGGATTTLTGTVYNPSGELPLYNAYVYVPNGPLDEIPTGPSCDRCETQLSGDPLVWAVTDATGRFVLSDVPAGEEIPLVIQIGKWRREVTLGSVPSCTETQLDAAVTSLPRNQGQGHIPRIALSTGEADALECFLKKMGLDQEEFTPEGGTGRVNLFKGSGGTGRYRDDWNGGGAFTDGEDMWDPDRTGGENLLMGYDIVLHSCEGSGGPDPDNKSGRARDAFEEFVDAGGRAFLSHWHNYWIREGAAATMQRVGDFRTNLDDPGNPPDDPPLLATIQVGFEKGRALADWLMNVGGSTVYGQISLSDPEHTLVSIDQAIATSWIETSDLEPDSIQYISFNTPIGVDDDAQCGRVVFSDIHVSSGDDSANDLRFPDGCTTTGLTPEEKALAFMLFDLSSCITPDVSID